MPEGKNQHYVPQHILREWADNGRTNVFHLPSGTAHSEPIHRVCADNYLYGHAKLEHELSSLEGEQAVSTNMLQHGDTLASFEDHHTRRLYSFVTTQQTRTKSMQLDIELSGEESIRAGIQDDMEAGRYEDRITWTSSLDDLEKEEALLEASIQGIHHRLIVQGIFGFMTIADLRAVMLCNVTDREFVISDTPVVLDNPRFKQRHGLVRAGIANRGLQILCPISPRRILLLYDPAVYTVKSNSKHQMLIRSPDAVSALNLLQFHNANRIVLYDSCSDGYIERLAGRIDEVRRREKITETFETETGGSFDVEYTPPHQIPMRSPDIPGCGVIPTLDYVQRRPTSKAPQQERLVNRIFKEVHGATDAAVIYAIRLFQANLN